MTFCKESEPFYGNEIAIYNASQVNVVHPRFLRDLKKSYMSFKGVNNQQTPIECGIVRDQPGFFECVANDNARIGILSQDDVERKYRLTYVQGKSITFQMGDQDLVFKKKNKLYVEDFSSWIAEGELDEANKPLKLTTIKREFFLESTVRKRVFRAKDFVCDLESGLVVLEH